MDIAGTTTPVYLNYISYHHIISPALPFLFFVIGTMGNRYSNYSRPANHVGMMALLTNAAFNSFFVIYI